MTCWGICTMYEWRYISIYGGSPIRGINIWFSFRPWLEPWSGLVLHFQVFQMRGRGRRSKIELTILQKKTISETNCLFLPKFPNVGRWPYYRTITLNWLVLVTFLLWELTTCKHILHTQNFLLRNKFESLTWHLGFVPDP